MSTLRIIYRNDPIINTLNFDVISSDDNSLSECFYEALYYNNFINRIFLRQKGDEVKKCPKSIKKILNLLLYKPKFNTIEIENIHIKESFLIYLAEILMKLPQNREKIFLYLRKCNINTVGALALAKAIKHNAPIVWLDLRYNEGIGDEGCKALFESIEYNTSLIGLDLILCGVNVKALEALSKSLPKNRVLQTVFIQNVLDEACMKYFGITLSSSMCQLSQLFLWSSKLNLAHIKILCRSLKNNNKLQQLGLSYNELDDDCAFYLARLLRNNNSITKVHIGSNKLTDASAAYLSLALTANKVLDLLNISRNEIDSDGLFSIYMALMNNSTLNCLDIRYNNFSGDIDNILGLMLERSKCLKTLKLSGNVIKHQTFLEKLRYNTTLTTLELRDMSLDTNGFDLLCESLCSNNNLETIDVSENSFYANEYQNLTKFLKCNRKLSSLSMENCSLGDTFLYSVMEGLRYNSTLKNLYLKDNVFSEGCLLKFVEVVSCNNSLTSVKVATADSIRSTLSNIEERNKYIQCNNLMRDLQSLASDRFMDDI